VLELTSLRKRALSAGNVKSVPMRAGIKVVIAEKKRAPYLFYKAV